MKLASKIKNGLLAATVLAAFGSITPGCNNSTSDKSGTDSTATSGDDKTLLGAGSTFVYPLFSKQFSEYNKTTGLKINFFARFDTFNPDNKIDNAKYNKYIGNTGGYNDPSTKETFITAGVDFTPVKNVHLMPNIWYNRYTNQGFVSKYNSYDLTYRFTFYYVFGK